MSSEVALYKSILQKLKLVEPEDLAILEAFTTALSQQGEGDKEKSTSPHTPAYWRKIIEKAQAAAKSGAAE